MIRKSFFAGATLWAIVIAIPSFSFAAHPYHASLAEIEWNPKSGNFEVSLCVWPADLEKAISRQQKESIDLDAADNLDALMKQYVASRLSIVPAAEPTSPSSATIRWVGHQMDLKKAWLYFEIPGNLTTPSYRIENRIFFELNEDQINQVQIKTGPEVHSIALNSEQPAITTRVDKQLR